MPTKSNLPSLADPSPGLRNLVGALRGYGFGVEVLAKNEIHDDDTSFWRGDPSLLTHEPVWGDDIRAERIAEFQNQHTRPSQVRRSATAPATYHVPPQKRTILQLGQPGHEWLKVTVARPTKIPARTKIRKLLPTLPVHEERKMNNSLSGYVVAGFQRYFALCHTF